VENDGKIEISKLLSKLKGFEVWGADGFGLMALGIY